MLLMCWHACSYCVANCIALSLNICSQKDKCVTACLCKHHTDSVFSQDKMPSVHAQPHKLAGMFMHPHIPHAEVCCMRHTPAHLWAYGPSQVGLFNCDPISFGCRHACWPLHVFGSWSLHSGNWRRRALPTGESWRGPVKLRLGEALMLRTEPQ